MGSMSHTAEAPTIGLGRLLKEGSRFLVPHHQRDYSWTADEIDQLFVDIQEARDAGQDEYFLGLMVFMRDGEQQFVILDGQQRLATATIALAAVRGWLRARDKQRDADQVQNHFIAVRELGRDDFEPRLMLNENNHPYFDRFVIQEAPDGDIQRELNALKRYDPSRLLLESILTCRAKIADLAESITGDNDQKAEELFNWVRFVEQRVKIVRLTVATEADAYTVFETLNDRGLDLTVLDLVKNSMFGKAGGPVRLREVQGRWAQMVASLSSVRADDFLKTWWTSRHGRVQKAQLFPRFKKEVSTAEAVRRTSTDMLKAAEQYAALEVADDPLWADLSDAAREHVRALKLLGGKQVHPVLLAALERFSAHEMERLLRLLEVLLVRYQLIGGGRTGRLEIACAGLARRIWKVEVTTATQASADLKDIMPNDKEFQQAFANKQETVSKKIAFLLRRLERQARANDRTREGSEELDPSISLTVEHILPKNPGTGWAAMLQRDPEVVDECANRLGNICLLSSVNRKLGNRPYSEKRSAYAASDLLLTQSVAAEEEWGREAIERRQGQLAKLARAVWRFE